MIGDCTVYSKPLINTPSRHPVARKLGATCDDGICARLGVVFLDLECHGSELRGVGYIVPRHHIETCSIILGTIYSYWWCTGSGRQYQWLLLHPNYTFCEELAVIGITVTRRGSYYNITYSDLYFRGLPPRVQRTQ